VGGQTEYAVKPVPIQVTPLDGYVTEQFIGAVIGYFHTNAERGQMAPVGQMVFVPPIQ
jgi:hypothetical protein